MRDFNKWFDMDYEKAYKEALKRAKSFRTPDNKDVAAYIFPELAESKDERMMKKIIATIHLYYGEPLEDEAKEMIAWLEKQGEQKPTEWSEEDEKMYNVVHDLAWESYKTSRRLDIPTFGIINDWLESIKYKVQPQPKQEWSEEEKMQLDAAIHLVSSTGHIETTNWLKVLKDRVLQQNITVTDEELDKAKKDAYNDALDKIEYHSGEPTFDDGWSAAIWYLKKKLREE